MPAIRTDLHELVERLPETELPAARRFLEFLSTEPVGPAGIEQADSGQTIDCHNYDEMVEKILHEE